MRHAIYCLLRLRHAHATMRASGARLKEPRFYAISWRKARASRRRCDVDDTRDERDTTPRA